MTQKLELTSIISKYYLNGINESVIWDIKNNILNIKFSSPSKEMLGNITFHNFPLEDSKIGINNTTQLNKLISVTNNSLDIKYIKNKDIPYKLIIADHNFTLNYTLADLMLIPKSGDIKDNIDFDIKAVIDNDSIHSIVKAKNAIAESEIVVIKSSLNDDNDYLIELEFGGNIEHANKISFFIPNIEIINTLRDFKTQYNSNMIKEIMHCNKDMHYGEMYINLEGIMKLEFSNEEKTLTSTYYLIAKNS
jgi:hypothetical protein